MTNQIPTLVPVIPEIFVFSMACVILLLDPFLSDRNRIVTYALSLGTLAAAAVLTYNSMSVPVGLYLNDMFIHDAMSAMLKLVIYVLVFLVFVYSRAYIRDRGMYRGEYFVLALFGVVGMMVMASASNFLTVYLGLELMSLSLYSLVAFQRESSMSTEAAMKYFILGAMASGMLLYGMSMLYGITGSLDLATVRAAISEMPLDNIPMILGLVFIVVALAFKLGAVPFHMWVPDVYHGAATSVTLYISTAPKIAAFAMFMRLLIGGLEGLALSWQDMLIILSVLSMGIGNLIAIAQSNIKRMLAYSAISHMGFFLLGMLSASENGYSSAMFYVLVYAFMSLGSFGMVIMLSRAGFEAERLEDFKGLNQRSPRHALFMLLLMFSMAGVPPTLGFFAKLQVIQAVVDAGLVWVAVLAVLFAVIGAYYYIRVVKLMYFDEPEETGPIPASMDVQVLVGANALALVVAVPWIGAIMDWCIQAVRGLT